MKKYWLDTVYRTHENDSRKEPIRASWLHDRNWDCAASFGIQPIAAFSTPPWRLIVSGTMSENMTISITNLSEELGPWILTASAGCTETNVEGQILSGCGADEKMVLTPHLQTPLCPAKNLDEWHGTWLAYIQSTSLGANHHLKSCQSSIGWSPGQS